MRLAALLLVALLPTGQQSGDVPTLTGDGTSTVARDRSTETESLETARLVELVSEKRNGGRNVTLRVRNDAPYTVTVTVEMPVFENMSSSATLPLVRTVGARRTVEVARLSTVPSAARWRWRSAFAWRAGGLIASHDPKAVYHLPYAPGTRRTVIQGFNGSFSHFGFNQYGVDFAMPEGTPVLAARDGVVAATESRYDVGEGRSNYILIEHADTTMGGYYHLERGGVRVAVGQRVRAGQTIGLSGNTGPSSRPHLHFMVWGAVDGRTQRSIPFAFTLADGTRATPVEGRAY